MIKFDVRRLPCEEKAYEIYCHIGGLTFSSAPWFDKELAEQRCLGLSMALNEDHEELCDLRRALDDIAHTIREMTDDRI